MKNSIHECCKAEVGIKALSHGAGTVTGAAIDRIGFEEALIVLNSGLNQATGTATVTVEHCDTSGGTYAAITGAAFAVITTSNDVNIYVGRINLKGVKRYIHVKAVIATAACELGVEVILGQPVQEPVTQVNAVVFSV